MGCGTCMVVENMGLNDLDEISWIKGLLKKNMLSIYQKKKKNLSQDFVKIKIGEIEISVKFSVARVH